MRMDESARTNEEGLYIYIFVVAKDMPKQGEKTLKPRPNNRIRTNELHCVHHRNFGLFDNSPVPQFELWRTQSHPIWLLFRGFFMYHGDPPFAHPTCTDKVFIDVTQGNPFHLQPLWLAHASSLTK